MIIKNQEVFEVKLDKKWSGLFLIAFLLRAVTVMIGSRFAPIEIIIMLLSVENVLLFFSVIFLLPLFEKKWEKVMIVLIDCYYLIFVLSFCIF